MDLPKTPDSTELQRIRIGDIIVVESARTAKPPFAEGAFYYFVAENALLRWDGIAWKQLNADTDLTSVETSIQNEIDRSTAKDTEHDNAIKALQEALANYVTIASFTEFKTANTKAIEEAKKAGTDAQATANTAVANAATAQGTADNALAIANKAILKDGSVAMAADLDLGTKKIVNLAGPDNDNDAANKAYVDAAEASAKADASGALSRANEAYTLADTANKAAGTAQSTADGAVTAAAAAQSTADTAVANAATADGKAVTAQNDINAWKEAHANDYTNKQIDDKVSAAEGLANAAQSTADTAVANAATADSKAVAADAKAVAADGKAVTAQNTIDAWKEAHKDDYTNEQIDNKVTGAENLAKAAQNTADTAKSNAEAAQGTAN